MDRGALGHFHSVIEYLLLAIDRAGSWPLRTQETGCGPSPTPFPSPCAISWEKMPNEVGSGSLGAARAERLSLQELGGFVSESSGKLTTTSTSASIH